MITVRNATLKDAELIADMSRQTFYDSFAKENTKEDMDKFMNEQFTKAALMKEVGAERNIFLLACDGDDPVGRDLKTPPHRKTPPYGRRYRRRVLTLTLYSPLLSTR